MGKDTLFPDECYNFTPVIHDNNIYINTNGFTCKFDLDGNEVWKVETGAYGTKEPGFDKEGNLYVVNENRLKSLDKDGKERWDVQFGARGSSHSPLVGDDGKIYLIDDDNVLNCFNTEGKKEWSKDDLGAASGKPFLDKHGFLHFEGKGIKGAGRGIVHLDAKKKGRLLGITPYPSMQHTATDKKGRTYVNNDGRFTAFDVKGKEIWSVNLTGDQTSTCPAIGPDGNIYVGVRNHTIVCLQPDGKEKWRFEASQQDEPLSDNMAWGKDGTTYVTGSGGNWQLYAINPDGTKKWTRQEDKHISAPKVGSDGTVYTGGELYPLKAYNPDTGERIWKLDIDLSFGDNYKILDNKDIIAATRDGKLMRVHYTDLKEAVENEQKCGEKDLSIKKEEKWVEIGGVKVPIKQKQRE